MGSVSACSLILKNRVPQSERNWKRCASFELHPLCQRGFHSSLISALSESLIFPLCTASVKFSGGQPLRRFSSLTPYSSSSVPWPFPLRALFSLPILPLLCHTRKIKGFENELIEMLAGRGWGGYGRTALRSHACASCW